MALRLISCRSLRPSETQRGNCGRRLLVVDAATELSDRHGYSVGVDVIANVGRKAQAFAGPASHSVGMNAETFDLGPSGSRRATGRGPERGRQ